VLDRPQALEDLDRLMQGANRAKRLVEQILTFSRRSSIQRKPIALQKIVHETMGFMRATVPANVEIIEDIDDGLKPVLADPTQIQQLVMNLCTNALQSMRSGRGRLEVRLGRLSPEDRASAPQTLPLSTPIALLTVRDTGHGMSEETLAHIFEPFFTTKGPAEGTGLGLSVVHGIVKEHDGAITVQSKQGEGSSFFVYIPLIPTEDQPEAKEQSKVPRGKGEKILIVDDEVTLCMSMSRMLTRLGYSVVSSSTAAEALDHFLKEPQAYHMVITDMSMPQMSGAGLAAELRRKRSDIPIILMSGFDAGLKMSDLKSMGVTDLVIKPFDMAALGSCVAKNLKTSG
jgi:CheY-like chemotaxis protein